MEEKKKKEKKEGKKIKKMCDESERVEFCKVRCHSFHVLCETDACIVLCDSNSTPSVMQFLESVLVFHLGHGLTMGSMTVGLCF